MERVGTLINKLKEQFEQQQDADKLLLTTQLLLAELLEKSPTIHQGKVAITMPNHFVSVVNNKPIQEEQSSTAQPETTQENIAPIFPEIKAHHNKTKKDEQTGWLFEPEFHIPTLAHQEIEKISAIEKEEKVVFELKDTLSTDNEPSLNDKLKEEKTEIAHVLKASPVKDLKKAIGINDQYLFINELFRGDEAMYERSIKTINAFSIFAEAEYWIQRELIVKLGWDEKSEAVLHFNQLVKRRFS